MAASQKKTHNVAVLLFTGADILDFTGPLEILSHTKYNTDIENPEPVFKPTTIARYFSPGKVSFAIFFDFVVLLFDTLILLAHPSELSSSIRPWRTCADL